MVYNTIVHRYDNKLPSLYHHSISEVYVTNASNLLLLIQKLETIFLKNNYEWLSTDSCKHMPENIKHFYKQKHAKWANAALLQNAM